VFSLDRRDALGPYARGVTLYLENGVSALG
jgi:hypothetical protein